MLICFSDVKEVVCHEFVPLKQATKHTTLWE